MQTIVEEMRQKAKAMLASGAVSAVLGWKKGDFPYDPTPAFFRSAAELDDLVYDGFCGSNLSRYLIETLRGSGTGGGGSNNGDNGSQNDGGGDGRILVFLKPCDTYSLNQLLGEHRADRDKIYVVGVGCEGKIDIGKLRDRGLKGIEAVEENGENLSVRTLYGDAVCPREENLLEKCLACKGKEHRIYDERIGAEDSCETASDDRFAPVRALEDLAPDERYAFWRAELSKCIRCNACRGACPVCTCHTCIFENARSGVDSKANADDFEENLYHVIRAFHVAGRCTDCGECSRVCPQGIPLHLLNRKMIKDINAYFGEYLAGAEADGVSPLLSYSRDDAEPDALSGQKGANHA